MKATHARHLGCLVSAFLLSASFVFSAPPDQPWDYFRNSWNVIGLKDYRDGTRVTPENEMLLGGNRKLILRHGPEPVPIGRRPVKTLLDGWLPVILLRAEVSGITYDYKLWATPLPDVRNWQAAFHWPTESENYLNWIQVTASNVTATQTLARVTIEIRGTNSSRSDGWTCVLPPKGTMQKVFRIPFSQLDRPEAFEDASASLWLERTINFWRTFVLSGTTIEVPCSKAQQALRAAHVCQLIANDHGVLHAGEGFYDEFYIRDGGYQLLQYLEAGWWDPARKAAEAYLPTQRPDGRFETQSDQYDANGQAMWVLWNYYQFTRDINWLQKVFPAMQRAADWIQRHRRLAPTNSPFAGLLPPAPADGEYLWDGKHHIVGYDFWNLRGLLCATAAASTLGRAAEAEALRKEADAYRQDIELAWQRTGLKHFPPSWEKAGTHWGNSETLWPTPLFAPDDPRIEASLTEAREHHGGGFIEGTLRWTGLPNVIHPYLSSYISLASMIRGDHEKFVEEFYWYLLHSSASHAFPEGIYFKRRYAWSETIPHALGAANYAILLRHALAHEQADELHLLAGIPDWWFENGREIRLERAPTHFGELSLWVRGKASGVEIQFTPPKRNPPRRTILHLPTTRPLLSTQREVTVNQRAPQTRRWDFPAVIDAYQHLPVSPAKPIAGLVPFPLAMPVVEKDCRTLDLTPFANTDPFSAPFGVERPGKFLFTGLQPGKQTVAGVPFQLLDPASNQGRGLLVLQGANASAKFPREVEIPVDDQGKRLFLLGNVHGWAPEDEGAGEYGAIAEYVIRYADGTRQIVPLIPQRTTDDWATPPQAADVETGLTGDPWHLNVLAVELRPVRIETILFRDLGTSSAPVLAAATLEKLTPAKSP